MLATPRLLTLTTPLLLTCAWAQAQNCALVTLSWAPPTTHPGETATVRLAAAPGTFALIGIDEDSGPTFIPGIGTLNLGLTPNLAIVLALVPASGEYTLPFTTPCKTGLDNLYSQAVYGNTSGTSFCLSNPAVMHIQQLGTACTPPQCVVASTIAANFNGTAIPAGRSIWFNSVVRLNNVSPDAIVGYRNASIRFTANNQTYSLPIPDAIITVSPGLASAQTVYDAGTNQFETAVPASYSGNVFLSGLSFPVTQPLPGGIDDVAWCGEFLTNENGASFQWKWAAAVYTTFSTDYNALCIKPIDGSSMNPYPNSHHAGTPECFTSFVVGGARGGGGSNWTGSYSGTSTVGCN